MIGTALLLGLALGADAPAAAAAAPPPPAVLLLPLRPVGTVSVKQAAGIRFTFKGAVEGGGWARLLSESRDDTRQSDRCELELPCLRELARLRGADVLLAGTVGPAADGLSVTLVAVGPSELLRNATVILQGNADDDGVLVDRTARALLRPEMLRGALYVEGEAGAVVFLDGNKVGTLPLHQQLNDVPEGDHEVVVTRDGKQLFRRNVGVVHGETTLVRAVLLDEARIGAETTPTEPAFPWAAASLAAGGAALLVGGAVCGTLSLLAAREAEERAKAQQLLFPRDEALLFRGNALAWTADGLYVGGAALVATGAVLWLLPPPGDAP